MEPQPPSTDERGDPPPYSEVVGRRSDTVAAIVIIVSFLGLLFWLFNI